MANSKDCDEITLKMIEDACREAAEYHVSLNKDRMQKDLKKACKIIADYKGVGLIQIKIIEEGPRVSLCSLQTPSGKALYCCRYNSSALITSRYFDHAEAKKDFRDLNNNQD